MTRAGLVLLGAVVCGAALLGGVSWISLTALRLDREQAEARRQAALEENVRLALWRMDSELGPLVAREAAMAQLVASGAVAPEASDRVKGRFRIGDAGGAAPLAPGLDRAALLEALARIALAPAGPAVAYEQAVEQRQRSDNEYVMRLRSVSEVSKQVATSTLGCNPAAGGTDAAMVDALDVLTPVWLAGELLLARRAGPDEVVIGSVIDWAALRDGLLAQVKDLVPGATLEPVLPGAALADGNRMLAALPVRLVPSPVSASVGAPSPLRWLLGVAWAGVLLALLAVVALLAGVLALGERRAAFVSAVTHELRTPLTTLRTYTEMLAEGMVSEDKRGRYLGTLKLEAERLAHLVENVLAYARLERGRTAQRAEVLAVSELLGRSSPRLDERARAAGVTLTIGPAEPDLRVSADPGAVEQILFNLVDNACKYAARGAVEIGAVAAGGRVALRVTDDGPGISRAARRRLFIPFSRSAESAAGSAPGVGLGLALCRGLARAMGGELTLADTPTGTTFVLLLPRA